jgi:putative endonuclease
MKRDSTRKAGETGEDIALFHLQRRGYTIVNRNYTCVIGEIDIVAMNEGEIVFVEVKSRRSRAFGTPAEAVTAAKQKKISKTALYYLKERNMLDRPARFDVVTVTMEKDKPTVEIFQNAFDFIE